MFVVEGGKVPGGDQQIISAMLPDQLCAVITAAPGGEGSMAEWAFCDFSFSIPVSNHNETLLLLYSKNSPA
jgi:hypothetical protein